MHSALVTQRDVENYTENIETEHSKREKEVSQPSRPSNLFLPSLFQSTFK